jgi:hypothetical protein
MKPRYESHKTACYAVTHLPADAHSVELHRLNLTGKSAFRDFVY